MVQEKEEQVASALQQVTAALLERSQAEQSFMERYVTSLDDNQAQLEEQYIANAADYNALKDKCVPPLELEGIYLDSCMRFCHISCTRVHARGKLVLLLAFCMMSLSCYWSLGRGSCGSSLAKEIRAAF